ncbi:MAG: hypothetical protein U1F33_04140 [Alphaproteobacteria bacterium]
MSLVISASGRRLHVGDQSSTRSAYAAASRTLWPAAFVWMAFAVLTLSLIGFTLSLRSVGLLSGVFVTPAAAAEFSGAFMLTPSVQLSERQGAGAEELAAAMLVPQIQPGVVAVLAASDGSNVGPANAPGMQLSIAALASGIASMINYPFGFWCSDSFRVLAGSDASNLNRLCSGNPPAGGAVALRPTVSGDDVPPVPPIGPCESLEVLSQQTAALYYQDTRNQSGGTQTNALPSGSYNGAGGALGFVNANVQQNNGVDVNQQVSLKGGAVLGSRFF